MIELESIAEQAQELTLKHFGRTILLYVPLYLNNECDNECVYCGFANNEGSDMLSVNQVMAEAELLYQKGFRHVLLVAGEKRDKITLEYLQDVVSRLHEKFESISLEIFPLSEEEYRILFEAGVDGLTIYQETYNRELYKQYHPSGPKSDYDYRLETPERAGRAGFYRINIGALLGLASWQDELAALAEHAKYLKKKFWRSQISISFPRLKDSGARFKPPYPVSDTQLVEMICRLRIMLPTVGLVMSTRESAALRDNLILLGITQMSAESKTSPGGYSNCQAKEQFAVSDQRSLAEVMVAISAKGYEPVFKDWDRAFIGG
ncbi:2-iminoacetate synthase ThiH [Candidatus Saganbacteria bacterium CG08_land_8_20_14_0_20_45_16]|uniref:2-iminoacetate synthase ThiH n=1 Tax=Candidatus Saganbacteria bacterium CG08_land_8_20_14_0_20_45_16 TaxID=2014293 RepID=A0A2H0XZG0_UNCSA|nr:MAG: 2-iminoacetate synthase ThiH [Candidatus Saganbacteria bacterium CG08_land_8_20_14_0_20_45_16]